LVCGRLTAIVIGDTIGFGAFFSSVVIWLGPSAPSNWVFVAWIIGGIIVLWRCVLLCPNWARAFPQAGRPSRLGRSRNELIHPKRNPQSGLRPRSRVDVGAACLRECRAPVSAIAERTAKHDDSADDPSHKNQFDGADGPSHITTDEKKCPSRSCPPITMAVADHKPRAANQVRWFRWFGPECDSDALTKVERDYSQGLRWSIDLWAVSWRAAAKFCAICGSEPHLRVNHRGPELPHKNPW